MNGVQLDGGGNARLLSFSSPATALTRGNNAHREGFEDDGE